MLVWLSLSFCLQDQLRAAQGEISRRCSLPAQQRDGGVLRPGSPAAFTPQCQRSPGQGLHHEAGNQLPAHTQAARHKYVLVLWWVPISHKSISEDRLVSLWSISWRLTNRLVRKALWVTSNHPNRCNTIPISTPDCIGVDLKSPGVNVTQSNRGSFSGSNIFCFLLKQMGVVIVG